MTDSTQTSDERLSALLDGELPEAEADFLVRRLASDEQLRERWGKICRARDMIAGVEPVADAGFVGRIAAAIDAEPVWDRAADNVATTPIIEPGAASADSQARSNGAKPNSRQPWLLGAGLAASVALVTLLVVPVGNDQNHGDSAGEALLVSDAAPMTTANQPIGNTPVVPVTALLPSPEFSPSLGFRAASGPVSDDPALQAQLQRYLMAHTERAPMTRMQGLLPFAHVAISNDQSVAETPWSAIADGAGVPAAPSEPARWPANGAD